MLALAMGNWGQTELFPKASSSEIRAAKTLLTRYRRMKGVVDEFEKKEANELTPKQQELFRNLKPLVVAVEKAVALILDPEIKQIVERRYIKGLRHKDTVVYFNHFDPSTVDRKMKKGIESVAETLKLWE